MILLSGADLVLPDRVVGSGSLVIEDDRIGDILTTPRAGRFDGVHFDLSGHYIVPGFIDVHVHGVSGLDTLDEPSSIGAIAGHLPRFGVTAFCPTSLACSPDALRRMLQAVRVARTTRVPGGARVLPAHLESNFINPDYKGAQPLECLRRPPSRAADATPRQTECRGADARSWTRLLPHDRTSASSRWLPSCRTRST